MLSIQHIDAPISWHPGRTPLWRNGEEGGLYEPWDLSTLFQDTAGTATTGPDQIVGLMLDKRLWGRRDIVFVMMEQPQLVASPTVFSSAGWLASGGGWSFSQDKAVFTDNILNSYLQPIVATPVTAGVTYELTLVISEINGGGTAGFGFFTGAANGLVGYKYVSEPGEYKFIFTAGTGSSTIRLYGNTNGTAPSWSLSFLGLKRVPGNHLFQTTSGARPKLGRHPVGGRRNLLPYSEDFTSRSGGFGLARVPGFSSLGPTFQLDTDIGRRTFTPLIEDGSTGVHDLSIGVYNFNGLSPWPGNPSVFSWLVTRADRRYVAIRQYSSTPWRQALFDLDNPGAASVLSNVSGAGNFSAAWIEDVGSGVLRICVQPPGEVVGTQNSFRITGCDAAGNTSYTGTGGTIINAGGAQLELGLVATPYQKVVTSFDVTEQGVRDCWYLGFDGVDDRLLSANVDLSAYTKMTLAFSIFKADNTQRIIFGNGVNAAGGFEVMSSGWTAIPDRYGAGMSGVNGALENILRANSPASFAPPRTDVVTWGLDTLGAMPEDKVSLRVNGITEVLSIVDGTLGQPFPNRLLQLSGRGNNFLFNGNLYGLAAIAGPVDQRLVPLLEDYFGNLAGISI